MNAPVPHMCAHPLELHKKGQASIDEVCNKRYHSR